MRMAEFVAIKDMGKEKYVRSVCPINVEVSDDKGGVFIESAFSCFQVDCTYTEALAELNAAMVEERPRIDPEREKTTREALKDLGLDWQRGGKAR